MILATRWGFMAAGTATVLGVAAVVVFGWNALVRVSRDAERMASHLASVQKIERLEAEMHQLGSGSPEGRIDALDRQLDLVRHDPIIARDGILLALLDDRVAVATADRTPQAWARAAEVVSELEKGAIGRAISAQEVASEPVLESAQRLLGLGGAVIGVFAVLSALAFVRLRRERRWAQERLRRSDRLAALGTLAASVAHEINNPLATISGCADAVRDRLRRSPAGHDDSLEYLEMIRDETRRCRDIVRGLRDLARDTPPAMAPADLSALARDVVHLVEVQQSGKRVTFEVAGEAACEIVCDPDKVKQLLLNLLVNARDACADGGRVRLEVALEEGRRTRIVVEDDGQGISREELERIFEPFHTSKTRGLGLGLFLCERIATLHGGTIRAESGGPGRGARFVVHLPSAAGAAVGAAVGEAAVPAR